MRLLLLVILFIALLVILHVLSFVELTITFLSRYLLKTFNR